MDFHHRLLTAPLAAVLALYVAALGCCPMGRLLEASGFDPLSPRPSAVEQLIAAGRYAEALPMARELHGAYPDEPLVGSKAGLRRLAPFLVLAGAAYAVAADGSIPHQSRRPRPVRASRDDEALAASYSAVYAVLRANGSRLYIVDAVQHREYAYEREAASPWRVVSVTAGLREVSQRVIREHIDTVNRVYGVKVRQ